MNAIFNLFDRFPAIPIGILVVLLVIGLRRLRGPPAKRKEKVGADKLDTPLHWWSQYDCFRVRDLLNGGVAIFGRAGSGKTSSSGATLMRAIVRNRKSGGLILAAKHEDVGDVRKLFLKAGRIKDLIVFDAEGANRCNFFGCLKRPRDVVTFITTLSEVMKRGDSKGGGDSSQFYLAQEERCIYNAVAALLLTAREPLTAPNIHRFIVMAATTQAELATPEWQAKYHSKVLEKGFSASKTALEAHDYQLCMDFWIKEWPGLMDPKTRGNILAGVQGTLHVMNSGIVREMVSGVTNCSPDNVLRGKWVLVNFPPASWGATGQLISAGWKQLVELAILERHATDSDSFVTIWGDEAHQFVTSFDSPFIAQCRSHKGCLVYLTQSVSSFYAAMKGEAGKHQADALLANFSHVIVHASDPVTARWASDKLGKRREFLFGGSSQDGADVWDELMGKSRRSSSFSEQYQDVLQTNEFMVGRTGGPANGYLTDAIVLKSGESFSDGRNYQRVTFSQKLD